jgi:hypothetical protein
MSSNEKEKKAPSAKKTPEEAWDALEQMRVDDEVDRVLGLSEAQLDAELKDAGADPAKVRARGEAIGRELDAKRAATKKHVNGGAGKDVPAKPEKGPSGLRRRWIAWGVPAVAAAGWLAFQLTSRPPLVAHPAPTAAELRDEGLAACTRSDFTECAKKLDEAKELDPDGERAPRIVKAREDIARATKVAP